MIIFLHLLRPAKPKAWAIPRLLLLLLSCLGDCKYFLVDTLVNDGHLSIYHTTHRSQTSNTLLQGLATSSPLEIKLQLITHIDLQMLAVSLLTPKTGTLRRRSILIHLQKRYYEAGDVA